MERKSDDAFEKSDDASNERETIDVFFEKIFVQRVHRQFSKNDNNDSLPVSISRFASSFSRNCNVSPVR